MLTYDMITCRFQASMHALKVYNKKAKLKVLGGSLETRPIQKLNTTLQIWSQKMELFSTGRPSSHHSKFKCAPHAAYQDCPQKLKSAKKGLKKNKVESKASTTYSMDDIPGRESDFSCNKCILLQWQQYQLFKEGKGGGNQWTWSAHTTTLPFLFVPYWLRTKGIWAQGPP